VAALGKTELPATSSNNIGGNTGGSAGAGSGAGGAITVGTITTVTGPTGVTTTMLTGANNT